MAPTLVNTQGFLGTRCSHHVLCWAALQVKEACTTSPRMKRCSLYVELPCRPSQACTASLFTGWLVPCWAARHGAPRFSYSFLFRISENCNRRHSPHFSDDPWSAISGPNLSLHSSRLSWNLSLSWNRCAGSSVNK